MNNMHTLPDTKVTKTTTNNAAMYDGSLQPSPNVVIFKSAVKTNYNTSVDFWNY